MVYYRMQCKQKKDKESSLIDSSQKREDTSNVSLFVVQCDLYSEDGQDHRGHVYNPSSTVNGNLLYLPCT